MAIGDSWNVERIERVDPETGARTWGFDCGDSNEMVFYYHTPTITKDGRFMVFWSNVSGTWQIHRIDLTSAPLKSVQVSDCASDTDGRNFHSDSPAVDLNKNVVYYLDKEWRTIMRADLETLGNDWIFEAPEDFKVTHVCASETRLLFSYTEVQKEPKTKSGKFKKIASNCFYFPRSQVWSLDLEDFEATLVWGDMAYLTHCIPVYGDEDLMLYADQSAKKRNQEMHSILIPDTDDKQPLQLCTGMGLNYFSHCFPLPDQWTGGQYFHMTGVDTRNRYTDRVSFNGIVKPDGTNLRIARFPGNDKGDYTAPHHVHAAHADSWWVGDSMPTSQGNNNRSELCLMKNDWKNQMVDMHKILTHNHHHRRPFHIHPWIAPDEKVITYASEIDGHNRLQMLDLEGFLSDKGLE